MAKKEGKTSNKENTKNKKSFWKSFKAELKKVTWLTPKQLANNTTAVIAIVLLTAVIVFALDITFEAVNNKGINKIKEVISNQTTNESSEETTNKTTETNNNEVVDENTQTNTTANE